MPILEQLAKLFWSITPAVALFLLFKLLKDAKLTQSTKDHLWAQFDKIYVGLLLIFAFWLLTHNLKYYGGQDSVINQTWGVVSFFLGLLSGLITGHKNDSRANDKNPDGGSNVTKKIDSTTTISTSAVVGGLPQDGESAPEPTK